jgi:hypothetical protein
METEGSSNDFHNVGQLRKLLDGLPDEQGIFGQTVSTNGDAWQMWLTFIPKLVGNDFSLLQMHHPELKFMHPKFDLEQLIATSENLKKLMEEAPDDDLKQIMKTLYFSLEYAITKFNEYEYKKNRTAGGAADNDFGGSPSPEIC